MRGLREPDLHEIIKTNQHQGNNALRFSNDVIFLPARVPFPESNNISIDYGYFKTTQTSYYAACYFQELDVSGCLNLCVRIDVASGGTVYFKFADDSGTLWQDSDTSAATKSLSIPGYEADGSLFLAVRTTNASYAAYAQVKHISISARPFYST